MHDANFDRVKAEILQNTFLYDLRLKFRIEMDEYERLCKSLNALAPIWNSSQEIDKELMSHLYRMSDVAYFQSKVPQYGAEKSALLLQMARNLNELIGACLALNKSAPSE